jgi:hypothetical protein
MDTVCINFMGAPGVGKTTMAAYVFALMKMRGHSVEWVGEYAKKLVYLGRYEELNNQYSLSSKQADLLDALQGRVRFVVTDGALAHGLFYNRFNNDNTSNVEKTHDAIMRRYSRHINMNILLERGDYVYETNGRYQTEEESRAMDMRLKTYLVDVCTIPVHIFKSHVDEASKIVEFIERAHGKPTAS